MIVSCLPPPPLVTSLSEFFFLFFFQIFFTDFFAGFFSVFVFSSLFRFFSTAHPKFQHVLIDCQLLQCLFNPGAAGEGNSIVSVIGSGIFKCFKTAENSLKLLTSALAKREPQNYMAHAWLSEGERERMVLGTDTGELLIIEGTELKATLQLDPGSTVHSIAAYAKVSLLCYVVPDC